MWSNMLGGEWWKWGRELPVNPPLNMVLKQSGIKPSVT